MGDLTTYAENTWCPGCGNFGILNAFKRAVGRLEEQGIERQRIMISAGIGCHAKIFDYLELSGLYSIHGRSMATVQGMKVANPELKVVAFAGDGDAFGEGIAHMIFGAKRNADITVVVHDNGVYGLTTGQYTPTSEKGFRGRSTPRGSIEEPLNPLTLMLEAGATFVARGYSGKVDHLAEVMVDAVVHEGFSFVQVLQPCVTFHDTYKEYNAKVEIMESIPASFEDAVAIARYRDRLPIGVLYRTEKPVYHRELHGDWNPVSGRPAHGDRVERIRRLVAP
ncbi:MAG: 2-oxoglutarate synthase [Latescibacteria bacterium DG_63]|jgi:2-oxoglutarate ferredoxin oxidoreductase subunit beta|uniref:2-oxoglutarate synthase n=2 Tax=Bacteria division TA06 TaxID=1156500 RepID=A0A0S8JNV6_UNCT6|nr:MAG: 2-oxoglutarate synthase [Latescibacteria bacterium DG_63]KPK69115.1 MAG: 2-oxoglutarate synthase [candidate division TA06 bacterium SM23_40]KPL10899.1 MAG: 2-oxoglutarate synthase [candidate division TA06 bacterium SM1_40]